mmetsp:Transcript_16649/g.41922  ORF Transcript_16649/g.41922 Transcript_16649/m.41922 type:complete len:687 (+) Transcript_16649:83-2143(+)
MEWEAWVTLAVIVIFLVVLALDLAPPDLVMFTSLTFLWVIKIIPTDAFLKGFCSSGLATVGALFVVVKGMDASGTVDRAFRVILGRQTTVRMARARICLVMFLFSGLFNNTPLVAMIIPIIREWARSREFAPSLFLIPADFATVMGGLLTMIGTSTNLQVNDFLSQRKQATFGFLEPGYVGLPVGAVVVTIMVLISDWFLPKNKGGLFRELREKGDDLVTALEVTPDSRFVGKRVLDLLVACQVPTSSLLKIRRPLHPATHQAQPERVGAAPDANLNQRKGAGEGAVAVADGHAALEVDEVDEVGLDSRGLILASLEAEVHPGLLQEEGITEVFPVPPEEVAQAGDILLLSMSRDEVVEALGRWNSVGGGVRVSAVHASDLVSSGSEFVEVVLGPNCPIVGQPISRGGQLFESVYRTCLVAVRPRPSKGSQPEDASEAAGGKPVSTSSHPRASGTFAPGDTAMVVAPLGAELPKSDFFMITRVGRVQPPRKLYDFVPLVLFVTGLCLAATETVDMLIVAFVLLLVFIAGGWVKASDYAKVIDWRLLVLIGASTGMSEAMARSGLSKELAAILKSVDLPDRWMLGLLFTVMVIVTEVVTNNAAVALGLPIALDLAKSMNLKSHKPLTMAVMLGASVGFAMPMGYATHLMVMGPGGYTVKDFLKFGIVIDVLWIIGITAIMPSIYPLE